MGDFIFEFKESYQKLSVDFRERIYEAVIWCRDTYLHTPAIRAAIDSFLVLIAIYIFDRLLGHPVGLRMLYILPIWLSAKRGGRIPGYINVATTCAILTWIDWEAKIVPPQSLLVNTILRLVVMVGLMAFIEHFESSLRKYATMAKRDALTGALNRLGLDEYMARAIDKALGGGQALTIAMIDCDHFKQLNDDHGHEYGDHVLKTLARLLRRYSQGGTLARNGGDEFVLVLPGKTPGDARQILNRVNWKLREATVLGDRCASFTFGISRVGVDGTSTRDLIAAADRDMYLHKSARKHIAVVETETAVRNSA